MRVSDYCQIAYRLTFRIYRQRPVDSQTMDRHRLKYLFKEVLGVDVDAIVGKVTATLAVQRAQEVPEHSKDWDRYMAEKGGIVLLPRNVTDLGKKPRA